MQCPRCGQNNRPNARFCAFCRAPLGVGAPPAVSPVAPSGPGAPCPYCQHINRSGARFCGNCRADLSAVGPQPGRGKRPWAILLRVAVLLVALVALVVGVILFVLWYNPPQVSDYERILNILEGGKSWVTLSAIFWIVFLAVFAVWLLRGLTLSKVRLATQFFSWGLLNTFFFFGQPLITPIILPVLQCNHLNTNSANCLFGPFMRDLTVHMPVPLLFPFAALGSFLLAAVLLGRSWCGWVCPVGLFADLLTYIRQWFLKVDQWRIPQALHDRLIYFKYALLLTLFLLSASIGLAQLADPLVGQAYLNLLPEALRYEPDCMFCPAPALFAYWPMVLIPTFWTIGVNPDWLNRLGSLIATSWTYFVISILFVVFGLFIPRVFCRYFCWVRAMSNLVAKFSPIGIHKDVKACTTCRTCQRVCPMMVSQIMEEKEHSRLAEPECDTCLLCVESCPEQNLRLLVGPWKFLPLFPGQRRRVIK